MKRKLFILTLVITLNAFAFSLFWYVYKHSSSNQNTARPEPTTTPVLDSKSANDFPNTLPSIALYITPTPASKPDTKLNPPASKSIVFKMLKDVGEPYLENFGLTETDFENFNSSGVTVIQGNFDICASHTDVKWLLTTADKYKVKVILNAGSGEAEWGYTCDAPVPPNQKPVLEKDKLTDWVNTWKDYPALYAWDTSNEAGGNFPNAYRLVAEEKKWEEEFGVTLPQLQEVYSLVKRNDPKHPVMIRMNGWFFYDFQDNFFRAGNPFGKNTADIVMINTYSNVEGRDPKFVETVWGRAVKAILNTDPNIKFVSALAVWKSPTIFVNLPTPEILKQEIQTSLQIPHLLGISFFKYGASQAEWFLPSSKKGATLLWDTIMQLNLN